MLFLWVVISFSVEQICTVDCKTDKVLSVHVMRVWVGNEV